MRLDLFINRPPNGAITHHGVFIGEAGQIEIALLRIAVVAVEAVRVEKRAEVGGAAPAGD
jgi:hypothetical protein